MHERISHRHEACVWLDRCLRSRCEASWSHLLGRYGPRIQALIYAIGRDAGLRPSRCEVDELAQDLYLGWLHRGTRFRGRTFAQFWTFVAVSVRRLVIDRVRRVRADKRSPTPHGWVHQVPIGGAAGGSEPAPPADLCLHGTWTPEDRLLAAESYQQFQARFLDACREATSGDAEAEALAAVLLDGHSSVEISRAFGRRGRSLRPSTIDSWVHRLRKHLCDAGLSLPKRGAEPEGAWPPRLPSLDAARGTAARSADARGPERRSCVAAGTGSPTVVCTMGRS